MARDTDFDPEDFYDDYDPEDYTGDEITDLDQLWDLSYEDYGDFVEYEFHGTGDTGGTT